ncbi:MAG: hypothetical protein FJ255_06095 [Phycisphaerae bacterium]|nr:hypothetical protein [Phycisphaerae bacterium]
MRLVIRPAAAPAAAIDVTNAVVAAIARELDRVHHGNDTLNWLEAEQIVTDLLRRANGECEIAGRGLEPLEALDCGAAL